MHLCSPSTELFAFLPLEVVGLPLAESNELYATDESGVLCSPAESYCARLSPCSQEEADNRLLLDAADAAQKECRKVAILTVDTDVVIFAVASFSKTVPDPFLVAFGVASNCRYIAVHEIVFIMNPTECLTLPEPHAFIVCDTVPSFAGRGKKTAWEIWKSFSEFTLLPCVVESHPTPGDIRGISSPSRSISGVSSHVADGGSARVPHECVQPS